jgi:hypothetical protein
MRLTDFCNRFSTRAPDERSILEVSDALACTVTCDGAKAPAHDSSESAFDDASSASAASLTMPASFDAVSSASRSWWVPPIEGPSRDAPPMRRFRPQTGSASQPLTFSVVGSAEPKPFGTNQNRFCHRPVKGQQFSRLRTPSTRRVLARCRFRNTSNASPPPSSGLRRPGWASDASSLPANGRLDTAAFTGSSPASAWCRAPLVDFCNRYGSQARPTNRRNSRLAHPPCGWCSARPAIPLAKVRDRGFTGQGPAFFGF